MRMIDIIFKKRDGHPLTKEEIDFFITNYVNKQIPDYQVSALLMAIYFRGLNDQERLNLTNAMLYSGETIDLSEISGIKVDKHSTGGVGDKTSLVVIPLAASFGIKMAKMSGRGLGHTGGTLDKLESIPGFNIELSGREFINQVNEIGLAIIGQSKNITPADKLLYALRDVTGTVEETSLIASSIMSKKLASGADHIVLDVKVGSGAFMKNLSDAQNLGKAMVEIGKLAGVETVATLTDMAEPLGNAVGNALEVIEAIETLKGFGPKKFTELCIYLTAEILLVSKLASSIEIAKEMVIKNIENHSGLKKLKDLIAYQGGDPNVVDDYSLFPKAKQIIQIKYECENSVYIKEIDALKIGEASMILGSGRFTKEDKIDYATGIILNKHVGDFISKGDTIAYIHTNDLPYFESKKIILDAFVYSKEKISPNNIILDVIR